MLFGALVFLFGIVERLVEGWFRRDTLATILEKMMSICAYELGARVLILTIALLPFFAFWEVGRVSGLRRLSTMFFSQSEAPGDSRPPAS